MPFESDRHDETVERLEGRGGAGVQFQLPVASVVETGAHVGRIVNGHHRRECAERLDRLVGNTLDRSLPWTFTSLQWDEDLLRELIAPTHDRLRPLHEHLATQHLEMGDLLIVAEFRRVRRNLDKRVVDVDVWTYDAALRGVINDLRG